MSIVDLRGCVMSMRGFLHAFRLLCSLAVAIGVLFTAHGAVLGQEGEEPDLRLRASPRVAFAGNEILLIAELRGGDDDYRELYCVTVEWDWDDDTHSETTPDCDPYEPGVSKIRRRYSTRHRFDIGGRYEIRINLKRRDDVVASARTSIEIRGQRIR